MSPAILAHDLLTRAIVTHAERVVVFSKGRDLHLTASASVEFHVIRLTPARPQYSLPHAVTASLSHVGVDGSARISLRPGEHAVGVR